MIDGETRRRKCNLKHLEPSKDLLKINKGADHNSIKAEFKKLGIDIIDTKPKQTKPKKIQIRAAERKKMMLKENLKKKTEKKKYDVSNTKKETTENTSVKETKLEKVASEDK